MEVLAFFSNSCQQKRSRLAIVSDSTFSNPLLRKRDSCSQTYWIKQGTRGLVIFETGLDSTSLPKNCNSEPYPMHGASKVLLRPSQPIVESMTGTVLPVQRLQLVLLLTQSCPSHFLNVWHVCEEVVRGLDVSFKMIAPKLDARRRLDVTVENISLSVYFVDTARPR